jgi:hypothetical protein
MRRVLLFVASERGEHGGKYGCGDDGNDERSGLHDLRVYP